MESVPKNEIGEEDSFENDMIQELMNEEERKIEEVDPTKWEKIDEDASLTEILFNKIPASKILVTCNLDPVELFDHMFDDTFFLTLSTETNRYYRETLKNKKQYSINWKDVTIDEMKSFMGIILLLQVNQKKSLHEHWDKNLLIASPVSSLISENQFKLMCKYFHYNDNNIQTKTKT